MYKKIILIIGLILPSLAVASDRPAAAESDRPAMSERAAEPAPVAKPATTTQTVRSVPGAHAPETTEYVQQQVSGDVLEMQPGDTITINPLDFPRRGMTMDKVQNELGRPLDISPTVGEPPITSWTYPDRIVYFEHSNVIHVVEKR